MTGQPTNLAVSEHTTPTLGAVSPPGRLDSVADPTHARVGQPAPDFKATVIIGRRFEQVRLGDDRLVDLNADKRRLGEGRGREPGEDGEGECAADDHGWLLVRHRRRTSRRMRSTP